MIEMSDKIEKSVETREFVSKSFEQDMYFAVKALAAQIFTDSHFN